ncbi:hypothetical protein MNBD_ALPHA03-342 [hydrothermal vent metagenome]|uniref:Flagellar basal-body/hook protein C-terminal domain-containing protein n=1 Tax=hydrothermal vent metagenome TaxID=652676 RepID=A0A3B1AK07_9ZZZZ
MFKAIQTSVSGLIASSTRLNVAANNIVNSQVRSSPEAQGTAVAGQTFKAGYTPQRVEQTSLPTGGTRATTISVSPASLSVYDPSSSFAGEGGFVNLPNVSFPAEIAEMIRASHAYKANAKTLSSIDETFKALLKV